MTDDELEMGTLFVQLRAYNMCDPASFPQIFG